MSTPKSPTSNTTLEVVVIAVPDVDRAGSAAAKTTFESATALAGALRRAEAAHSEHEKRTGQKDANWPDWYAKYIVSEQAKVPLPF